MIQRTEDWRRELDWVRQGNGIILFEAADWGELQDSLRRDGFNVIGGSAVGDRMESDRDFGQQCMRDAGMATAPSRVSRTSAQRWPTLQADRAAMSSNSAVRAMRPAAMSSAKWMMVAISRRCSPAM